MRQLVANVKSTFISKEFIKFLIVGIINTFNSTLFASIYEMVVSVNIAFIMGYITSLGIAYILNSKVIFYKKLKFDAFIRFAISYIPNFIIQNLIVLIVYNIWGLSSILAYMIAAIIGVPVTFICVKVFVFNKINR